MRRRGLIGSLLCVFAIWVQLLAPVAAAVLVQTDPLAGAVVCAHDVGSENGGSHHAPAPDHHHCPLCQMCVGGGVVPTRPAFTALDYPVASPVRWQIALSRSNYDRDQQRPGQPRGPPALA